MNKLTKGQKDYKRRKQQGLKDARLVEREDGKRVPRITKRQLCVRVSQEASEDGLLTFIGSENALSKI